MKCRTLSLCLYVGMLYCEGENPASAATIQTPTKAPDMPLAIRFPMYVYLLWLQPSYDLRRCGAPKLTCEWFSYPHIRCGIAVAAGCLSLQKPKHEGFIGRSVGCCSV